MATLVDGGSSDESSSNSRLTIVNCAVINASWLSAASDITDMEIAFGAATAGLSAFVKFNSLARE